MTSSSRSKDLKVHFFTRAGVVKAVDGVSFAVGARRGARPGRRVRLGQDRHRPLHPRPRRSARPHRRRLDPLPGRGAGRTLRGGAARRARPQRRDDLPGPDDDAQSGAARRHPDDRGDHRARAACRRRPRAPARATRSPRSASRRRRSGSTPIRTSSPAACASASRSRSRCCTGRALLIADEPTTALDVTIQSQILAEVQTLAAETGTALIWITHDLAVIAGLADRIAVMYAGRIVEQGPVDARARARRCIPIRAG